MPGFDIVSQIKLGQGERVRNFIRNGSLRQLTDWRQEIYKAYEVEKEVHWQNTLNNIIQVITEEMRKR